MAPRNKFSGRQLPDAMSLQVSVTWSDSHKVCQVVVREIRRYEGERYNRELELFRGSWDRDSVDRDDLLKVLLYAANKLSYP